MIADAEAEAFNQYRRRLKDQGIVDVSQCGKISFSLPLLKKAQELIFLHFIFYVFVLWNLLRLLFFCSLTLTSLIGYLLIPAVILIPAVVLSLFYFPFLYYRQEDK